MTRPDPGSPAEADRRASCDRAAAEGEPVGEVRARLAAAGDAPGTVAERAVAAVTASGQAGDLATGVPGPADSPRTDLPAHPGRPGRRPGPARATAVRRAARGFAGDPGSRRLADQVLNAVASGDAGGVAELLGLLDVDQLRSLVRVLADRTAPAGPAERGAASAGEVCAAAMTAAAEAFGTSPEEIVGPARRQSVSDARAVAMTVARQVGLSLPAIAEHFGKDHGSVIHAVRRAQGRPRLAAEATRIGHELDSRYLALGRAAAAGPSTDAAAHGTASASAPCPASPAPGRAGEVVLEHAVATAARAFETTPTELLGTGRTRSATDARAVAMTAARMCGQSLPAIARHFCRDHTTVLHATRRIARTPPLRALAEQIAAGGPETGEPPHRTGRPLAAAWDPAAAWPASTPGVAREQRETGLPATPRHLGVAR